MAGDAWWRTWSQLESFEALLDAVRDRLQPFSLEGVHVTVEDADGGLHLIGERPDWWRAEERETATMPSGWAASDLAVGGRRVGQLLYRSAGASTDPEGWADALDEIAAAVDLVAARFGRRRLRVGLATLHELGVAFAAALEPTEVATITRNAMKLALEANDCIVFVFEGPDLTVLSNDAGTVVSDALITAVGAAIDGDPHVRERMVAFDAASEMESGAFAMVLPLRAEEQVLGGLLMVYEEDRSFVPDDRRLASMIGAQCAQALLRMQLSSSASQARFVSALDAMLDLVTIGSAVRDGNGRIVDFAIEYMNRIQIDVAARDRDSIVGKRLSETYPAAMTSGLFDRYVEVVETGQALVFDEMPYADTIDGEPVRGSYSLQVARFGDGIIIATRDVTEMVDARSELTLAKEQLEAAQRLARMGIWRIDLDTQAVTFSEELYRIFEMPVGVPVPDLPRALTELIHPEDRDKVAQLVSATRVTGEPFTLELRVQRPSGDGVVLASGSVTYDESGLPGQLWGTAQDITEQRRRELQLSDTTARLEREHATVAMLQEAFTPTLPSIEWAEMAGFYLASGSDTDVGGDWYDAVHVDTDRVALLIGDVAGHGLEAVALMAQLRNALRACAVHGLTPGASLTTANRLLAQTDPRGLATSVFAVIDRRHGRMSWASAGHLPVLLVREGDSEFLVPRQNPPLGAVPGHDFVEGSNRVDAGQVLLLYTDGLVERRGLLIDVGLDELKRTTEMLPVDDLDSFCEALGNAMFSGRSRGDDVCLLALRVPG